MLYSILQGDLSISSVLMHILAVTVIVMLILPFHEVAHGYIAYKLGDDTAKKEGRLTLNPLHHIDYIGALCLLLVGFGWANPVPVNPYNLKNPRRDMAFVALAGPVANLIAALVGAILEMIVSVILVKTGAYGAMELVEAFFDYYVSVNVGLAVFNLIPLPPLDGSKILGAFLPTEAYVKMMRNERTLSIILIACVWLGVISKIVYYPTIWLEKLIYFIAYLPVNLFF